MLWPNEVGAEAVFEAPNLKNEVLPPVSCDAGFGSLVVVVARVGKPSLISPGLAAANDDAPKRPPALLELDELALRDEVLPKLIGPEKEDEDEVPNLIVDCVSDEMGLLRRLMDELVARVGSDGAALADEAPGLSAVHAAHLSLLASFLIMQVEHSHLPLLRPANEALKLGAAVEAAGLGALSAALGVMQHAHCVLSASFLLKHVEQSHLDAFLLANSADKLLAGVSAGTASAGFFSPACCLLGLAALQQAHLSSLSGFEAKQSPQLHLVSPPKS